MIGIGYRLCDPNGNITVLVTEKIGKDKYVEIADEISKEEPTAEQVGFIINGEGNNIELNMAGGEFCANATLCAAVYKMILSGFKKVNVKVSGLNESLKVVVEKGDNLYIASVDMPMPKSKKEVKKTFNGKEYIAYEVDFGSITHLVMKEEIDDIEGAIKEWCTGDAQGLLFYDEEKSFLTPYVYVKKANTFFRENSCASGTTALGIYLSTRENKLIEKDIYQPGGMLKIKAAPNERVNLTGTVKFLK